MQRFHSIPGRRKTDHRRAGRAEEETGVRKPGKRNKSLKVSIDQKRGTGSNRSDGRENGSSSRVRDEKAEK